MVKYTMVNIPSWPSFCGAKTNRIAAIQTLMNKNLLGAPAPSEGGDESSVGLESSHVILV